MWFLGKIHQRLGNSQRSLDSFLQSYHFNPQNPNVAREVSQAALNVGHVDEAVDYCQRACRLEPNDAGLKSNLALALLLSGKVAEAKSTIDEASALDVSDTIIGRIQNLISDVLVGARGCPRSLQDLR